MIPIGTKLRGKGTFFAFTKGKIYTIIGSITIPVAGCGSECVYELELENHSGDKFVQWYNETWLIKEPTEFEILGTAVKYETMVDVACACSSISLLSGHEDGCTYAQMRASLRKH